MGNHVIALLAGIFAFQLATILFVFFLRNYIETRGGRLYVLTHRKLFRRAVAIATAVYITVVLLIVGVIVWLTMS